MDSIQLKIILEILICDLHVFEIVKIIFLINYQNLIIYSINKYNYGVNY